VRVRGEFHRVGEAAVPHHRPRFNRRYDLAAILPRLTWAAVYAAYALSAAQAPKRLRMMMALDG
jgi:hypothetical protein